MPFPAQKVFDWHKENGALARLTPPWQDLRLLAYGGIHDGNRTVLKMRIPFTPFYKKWIADHVDYEEGVQFADIQRKGPFSYWKHIHRVIPDGEEACIMEEEIQYKLPFHNSIGRLFIRRLERSFRKAFAYRHRILQQDLAMANEYPIRQKRILVTGASGLVGSALVPLLESQGHEVFLLVRRPSQKPNEIYMNVETGFINEYQLENFDVVIHLAGENIGKRWTRKRRERIVQSRQGMTQQLSEAFSRVHHKPEVFLSASAIGLYQESFARPMREDGTPDTSFLADVVQDWEGAVQPLRSAGIRVVFLRFGVVLSQRGGALRKLLPIFKLSLGGRIGTGKQMMSWVALDDVLAAIYHLMYQNVVTGPINIVSPHAESNRTFTRVLCQVLSRPGFFPIPTWIIRFLYGEMGEETVLKSIHAYPQRLLNQSFHFRYPHLKGALEHLLGKKTN